MFFKFLLMWRYFLVSLYFKLVFIVYKIALHIVTKIFFKVSSKCAHFIACYLLKTSLTNDFVLSIIFTPIRVAHTHLHLMFLL